MTQEYGAFAAVYDRLMADVDYGAWAAYLGALLHRGGVRPGESVLECACGTGEITLRLKKAGYAITASDLSERMLEIAQQKARKAGQKIAFIRQDMRSIDLHKPVSAVVSACDGVNYLLSDADLDAFFAGANRALEPGGLLVFDVSSAYKLEHVLGGHTFGEDGQDCAYIWQNCFDERSKLLEMRLAFFLPDGKGAYTRFDERHIQRAHETDALTASLRRAGFALEGVFEAFTEEPPNPKSERIQFVARKLEFV